MKKPFICLPLFLAMSLGIFVLTGCGQKDTTSRNVNNTPEAVKQLSAAEQAAAKAQEIYNELKNKGTDFSNGPCLAENLMTDWVADIAHKPRQAVDNLPRNQCQSYRNGQAHHFVELDPNGAFIRAY